MYHFYEPTGEIGLPYSPVNAIIAPRPIGWISSLSASGEANLAPYSYFNVFNRRPPIIGFSSMGYKDSVRNIEATGEFVWNLVDESLADAMNATSAPVPGDEFEVAGLSKRAGRIVSAPLVDAAKVNFECRLSQIVQLTTASGTSLDTWLILGEVVGVHIREDLLVDGLFDTSAAQPIARAGGPATYFKIGPSFEMPGP
ncbi:Flavin reductase like domain protein [Corynebacterium kalinowskii]|uniref:Flavin reductase like domain protein n=1 Tax=Corynebacterium kalinowskii TaxID=2675216 RepID=A0A6B8VMP3_9CORY|nr:flavin reductase family protein [Corynebacterium kalinowskii]QGU01001.1 Flavin reductase like domain protein [Corynebacterium kalinowskii]